MNAARPVVCLLALASCPWGAGFAQERLLVPWESLAETGPPGDRVFQAEVAFGELGEPLVAGNAGWPTTGLPAWLPVDLIRLRERRGLTRANLRLPCDYEATALHVPENLACRRVLLDFRTTDPSEASHALARLLAPLDADPVGYTEPYASAILGRSLGTGPMSVPPRLQAEVLWAFRPVDGWPRIDWAPDTRRPTIRVDVGVLGVTGGNVACRLAHIVADRLASSLGFVGEGLLSTPRRYDVELRGVLVEPDSRGELEPEPLWAPALGLGLLERGLTGLFRPLSQRTELVLRARADDLERLAGGDLAIEALPARLRAVLGGEPIELASPSACPVN